MLRYATKRFEAAMINGAGLPVAKEGGWIWSDSYRNIFIIL